MIDDYKRGLITGLAMQPLCVATGVVSAKQTLSAKVAAIALRPLSVALTAVTDTMQTQVDIAPAETEETEEET